MTTVKQFTQGEQLPEPIYVHKPYVVLSRENVVLEAGSAEEIKSLSEKFCGYYDDCVVEVREYDLYMNDNMKIKDVAAADFETRAMLAMAED